MTFKELKRSSLYQSSDLDDMEVMICVSRKGKRQYEPLCFLGICPIEGSEFIVIGGLTEIQRMVENGEMEKPKGYIDPSQTRDLIEGENDDTERGS